MRGFCQQGDKVYTIEETPLKKNDEKPNRIEQHGFPHFKLICQVAVRTSPEWRRWYRMQRKGCWVSFKAEH